MEEIHTISLLLENQPGALSRVANLFSARGYNIESLSVAPTNDTTLSIMTISIRGSEKILTQICHQLEKLVDVFYLDTFKDTMPFTRELAILVCTELSEEMFNDIVQKFDYYHTYTKLNDTDTQCQIELYGTHKKINIIIKQLQSKITKIVRSGSVALGTYSSKSNNID